MGIFLNCENMIFHTQLFHVNLLSNVAIFYLLMQHAEMLGRSIKKKSSKPLLHDHRSYEMNCDDYQRACRIPKRKVYVYPLCFI